MRVLHFLLGACALAATTVTASVDVVAVYYPHWHVYPKGEEWFHKGWTEWEFVKTAKARFLGHKQPMVPFAGYLDGSNPADVEKEIALASNAGINVFLYDYYYYDGQITQEEALEKGFLHADNRNRMKFALMWCYHERKDQFRPAMGDERRVLMSLAHTPEEFYGLIDLCIERYFPRQEYWRKDGKLFFSIFNGPYFIDKHGGVENVRAMLAEARRRVQAAGLGQIHFNVQQLRPARAGEADACGFDSLTNYGFCPWNMPSAKTAGEGRRLEIDYAAAKEPMRRFWKDMSAGTKLPYIPIVSTGWDSTPRCRQEERYPWRKNEYPYLATFTNNTADVFRDCLAAAKAFATQGQHKSNVVYVNGWNEYTEGTYLVPNNWDGDFHLRAIADVFGRKPADEYTFVDHDTGLLHTVPAPTYANVPYGTHQNQKLDVWLPKSGTDKMPMVVYFHSGGWWEGSMVDGVIGSHIRMLQSKGVAVACVGFRHVRDCAPESDGFRAKGTVDDCENAVRFLMSKAQTWGIDRSRIGLSGKGSGATTAMILGYRKNNPMGIKALAPVFPKLTTLDPEEIRAWVPNSTSGANLFGYATFDDWLANRAACLPTITSYSPAALARTIAQKKAPKIFFRQALPDAAKTYDPARTPVWCWKFAELCKTRGLPCDAAETGDVFLELADYL